MTPYYPARDGHPSMLALDDDAEVVAMEPIHSAASHRACANWKSQPAIWFDWRRWQRGGASEQLQSRHSAMSLDPWRNSLILQDKPGTQLIIMLTVLFLIAFLIAYHRDRIGPGGPQRQH